MASKKPKMEYDQPVYEHRHVLGRPHEIVNLSPLEQRLRDKAFPPSRTTSSRQKPTNRSKFASGSQRPPREGKILDATVDACAKLNGLTEIKDPRGLKYNDPIVFFEDTGHGSPVMVDAEIVTTSVSGDEIVFARVDREKMIWEPNEIARWDSSRWFKPGPRKVTMPTELDGYGVRAQTAPITKDGSILWIVSLDEESFNEDEPDVALVLAKTEQEARTLASKGPGVRLRGPWMKAQVCKPYSSHGPEVVAQYARRFLPGNH